MEKYIDCFKEVNKPQRTRTKRGACFNCISIDELNFFPDLGINIGGE